MILTWLQNVREIKKKIRIKLLSKKEVNKKVFAKIFPQALFLF